MRPKTLKVYSLTISKLFLLFSINPFLNFNSRCEASILQRCFIALGLTAGHVELSTVTPPNVKNQVNNSATTSSGMVPILSNTAPNTTAHPKPQAKSTFSPVMGVPHPEDSNEKQDAFLIATGSLGEKIVRVIPKDESQSPFILKKYNIAEKHRIEKEGFTFLANIIDNNPSLNFSIARLLDSGPLTLKLSDVRGRNLKAIMLDNDISPELKAKIERKYDEQILALGAAIKKSNPEGYVDYHWEGGLRTLGATFHLGEKNPIPISVRWNQVVVSFGSDPEDFTLTIVDPF